MSGSTGSGPPTPGSLTSVGPELDAALIRVARGQSDSFERLLTRVEFDLPIDDTNLRWHCYTVQLDGNGSPRIRDMVKSLFDRILEFAIPRKQIDDAWAEYLQNGSSAKLTRLVSEAQGLFTRLEDSGEAGELLLFAFAESVLDLPQLVCKMDLKTSTQMHVHGADAIHVGVDQDNQRLRLFWGESKVHTDRAAAVRSCFTSIAPLLTGADGSDDRDRQLILRHMNIDDPDLADALRNFFDPESDAFQQVSYSGLCMVGFDYDKYPSPPAEITNEAIRQSTADDTPKWRGHVRARAHAAALSGYHIHVLCIPFPSVEEFRRTFNSLLPGQST